MNQLKKLNRRLIKSNQQNAALNLDRVLEGGTAGQIAVALGRADSHGVQVPEAVRRDLNKRGIG